MTVMQLLDEGRLAEAVARTEAVVAVHPDDLPARAALFDLLAFVGELDRAAEQLDTVERLDPRPEAVTGVRVYRALLAAERARQPGPGKPFAPRFFSPPPEDIALHREAIELCVRGHPDQARAVLERAEALAEARRGDGVGAAPGVVRDADDLFAPVLEVVTAEGYFWVPWEAVRFLQTPPPASLRDLLWAPARLATDDGRLAEVYLPNLYPGSARHPDPAVRLGRVTVWDEIGAGIVRAAGQKLCLVDGEPLPLLAVGEARFAAWGDDDGDGEDPAAEAGG
jgi:type VI secretion system protein ImpE